MTKTKKSAETDTRLLNVTTIRLETYAHRVEIQVSHAEHAQPERMYELIPAPDNSEVSVIAFPNTKYERRISVMPTMDLAIRNCLEWIANTAKFSAQSEKEA